MNRHRADFYGVAVAAGGRYLRRIANVSKDGLLLISALGDERPGQIIDLELPRHSASAPTSRIKFEVIYVTQKGNVGVRRLDSAAPLEVGELGGPIAL